MFSSDEIIKVHIYHNAQKSSLCPYFVCIDYYYPLENFEHPYLMPFYALGEALSVA